MGQRLISLGDRLRAIAQDESNDLNQAHLIARRALVRLLKQDPALMRPWREVDLRRAVRVFVGKPVAARRGAAARFQSCANGDWASPG